MNTVDFYCAQQVRYLAEKIGMSGDIAVKEYVKGGCQKTFLNQLANKALRLGKLSTHKPKTVQNP